MAMVCIYFNLKGHELIIIFNDSITPKARENANNSLVICLI